MSEIQRHPPVKLICAILFSSDEALSSARQSLVARFGPVDFMSDAHQFDNTNYYRDEMGDVQRAFVSFERLTDPTTLPDAKHATNAMEDALREPNGGRRVNLDIGYVSPAKLILATTKNYGHRVYLGDGVFADHEYWYRGGAFEPMPWTYPEYRQESVRRAFECIRRRYLAQLNVAGIPARMH